MEVTASFVTVLMVWRRRHREWLDGWEPVAARALPEWESLSTEELDRLRDVIPWMVRRKRWEAARGAELTQEMVITIATRAAMLLLVLDRDVYRHVKAIVVHPGTITQRGSHVTGVRGVISDGTRRVLGHAQDRRGPVVLSWRAVQDDLANPGRGHDVVAHEFAHKIDAADGLFDGTPEITDRSERARWIRTCTKEYRRLRRLVRRGEADSVLRAYGAQSPSEFFAVATEAFLHRPREMATHRPRLYRLLRSYYGQDPAGRLTRKL